MAQIETALHHARMRNPYPRVQMRRPYRKEKPRQSGHYIGEWRIFRNLTQERLADRVGLSVPQVSKIENGSQGYRQDTLQAFAEALGCEPADLLRPPPTSQADELRAYVDKLDQERAARALKLLHTAFDRAA